MNKFRNMLNYAMLIALALFTFSCDNGGGSEVPKKTGVLVINEGNFGSANGSISFYDEDAMTITNGVVKAANNGDEIGATLQSVFANDGVAYLVCNSSDKVEFISLDDYKYLANPVSNISQPRYMASSGDKAYISCWGPWDNWTLPNSYVAVMDIGSRSIVDTLACGSGAEGIMVSGNKLLVANSYESSVSVIDIASGESKKLELDAAPQHFVVDANKNIWVSVVSSYGKFPAEKVGLQQINISDMTKGDFVAVAGMAEKGTIAIDETGSNIYVMTAEAYPGTKTDIYKVNTSTKQLDSSPVVSGENFYGLACNVTTGKLYVADANAFSGNGKIYVYDSEGTKLDEQVGGIGPNGFVFK